MTVSPAPSITDAPLDAIPTATATANTFGAGGGRPYDSALVAGLHALRLIRRSGSADPSFERPVPLSRFLRPADATDRRVLRRLRGSVLDIGCGPGRMVRASIDAGFPALGIDVSTAAVALARRAGLPVLRRSVFEPAARGARWSTLLLLDGNVGIGGDPGLLLRRCVQLLADGGNVLAEVHPHGALDAAFEAVLADARGNSSDPFPWAEVGADGLRAHAAEAGLRVAQEWRHGGRAFVELERR